MVVYVLVYTIRAISIMHASDHGLIVIEITRSLFTEEIFRKMDGSKKNNERITYLSRFDYTKIYVKYVVSCKVLLQIIFICIIYYG